MSGLGISVSNGLPMVGGTSSAMRSAFLGCVLLNHAISLVPSGAPGVHFVSILSWYRAIWWRRFRAPFEGDVLGSPFRNSQPMPDRLRHKSETWQASTCLDAASVIDVASPRPCISQQEPMSRRAASARLKQDGSQRAAPFFRRSCSPPTRRVVWPLIRDGDNIQHANASERPAARVI